VLLEQKYAARFAGSEAFSLDYPQLALWARRIAPASLAWITWIVAFFSNSDLEAFMGLPCPRLLPKPNAVHLSSPGI
jgi:hypothetical protein